MISNLNKVTQLKVGFILRELGETYFHSSPACVKSSYHLHMCLVVVSSHACVIVEMEMTSINVTNERTGDVHSQRVVHTIDAYRYSSGWCWFWNHIIM